MDRPSSFFSHTITAEWYDEESHVTHRRGWFGEVRKAAASVNVSSLPPLATNLHLHVVHSARLAGLVCPLLNSMP